jgi:hypothetical protein
MIVDLQVTTPTLWSKKSLKDIVRLYYNCEHYYKRDKESPILHHGCERQPCPCPAGTDNSKLVIRKPPPPALEWKSLCHSLTIF